MTIPGPASRRRGDVSGVAGGCSGGVLGTGT
jgi:hypothetical protein